MWTALVGIALATLVSEDLTLIGIGEAVRAGHLAPWPAMAAGALGIFVGDVGLLVAGRLGMHGLARWDRIGAPTTLSRWVDSHPGLSILVSRVLPGARVPMYVAAGAWGTRPGVVVAWMLVATLLWTPFVVTGVALSGAAAVASLQGRGAPVWLAATVGVLVLLGLAAVSRRSRVDPARLLVRLERLRRWEFWPAWLLYAPVIPSLLLAAMRHRSLTVFTAANPAIDDGGFVGESKAAILDLIAGPGVLPAVRIAPGPIEARGEEMRRQLADHPWGWPLVGKPDVGQRGMAVRWLSHEEAALAYLAEVPAAVILQLAHPGPHEAGLYYVREPGATRGRLCSITEKHFPVVVGDGHTRLGCLVRQHARYRLQEGLFARRCGWRWTQVPARGERVPLGRVGNHAQGTEFRDGRHLWTAALEARVDAIARRCPGFHLGRFDVRYADPVAFAAGEDLAVVELNGVAAEPTHIYDPDARLVDAWQALRQHWWRAFAFGAHQRARGHAPLPLRAVLRRVRAHLTGAAPITSD